MPRKIHYSVSLISLLLIGLATVTWHDGNLPPLKPAVRHVILALYASWFISYWRIIHIRETSIDWSRLWPWVVFPSFFLCFMPPIFSGDLYEYLIRGRILSIYHQNPYVAFPVNFPNDLLRPYSIWITNPDAYGPISVFIQTLPAALFQHSVMGMIAAYKCIVWLFMVASLYFFWKIVHRLSLAEPGRIWAVFALCPLIWVQGLIDGHNDLLMMTFSIISLYFFLLKQHGKAFFFWTCAFLIKYTVILHLPFMILFAVRERWEEEGRFPKAFIMRNLLINLLVVILFFLPFWKGVGVFGAVLHHLGQEDPFYTNTIPYLIEWAMNRVGLVVPAMWVKWGCVGFYGVVYALLLVWCWRVKNINDADFYRIVSLAYLGFYASLYSPLVQWYLVWALFWIILARWPKSLWLVVLYSAVGVLAFYKRINFLIAIALVFYMTLFVSDAVCAKIQKHES